MCSWTALIEEVIVLPVDVNQLPDTFIYVTKCDDLMLLAVTCAVRGDDDVLDFVVVAALVDGWSSWWRYSGPDESDRFCFVRLKTADIMASGFTARPKWHHLVEDKSINKLDDDEQPGAGVCSCVMSCS
jgi:hypothetical protein